MDKHLVLTRDAEGDWYKQAKSFFAENKVKPLQMVITDEGLESNAFSKALSSLVTSTGAPVVLDAKAGILTFSALEAPMASSPHCECRCGQSSSCGGGGGGAPIIEEA